VREMSGQPPGYQSPPIGAGQRHCSNHLM